MNIAGNNSNSMPTGFLMVLVLVEIESFYVTVCSLDLDSFKNMFEISCKKTLIRDYNKWDINANSDTCHKQIKVYDMLSVVNEFMFFSCGSTSRTLLVHLSICLFSVAVATWQLLMYGGYNNPFSGLGFKPRTHYLE